MRGTFRRVGGGRVEANKSEKEQEEGGEVVADVVGVEVGREM